MKLSDLNEEQIAMIDPLDRQRYKIRLLSEELAACLAAGNPEEQPVQPKKRNGKRLREKDEQQTFIDWCGLRGIPCRHDRTDRPTTGNVGWPDFEVIYEGRILPLEFKVNGNKLSAEQREVHAFLARTGTDVLVCYSADEAIRKTMGWLWEHFRWTPDKDRPVNTNL